MTFPAPLAGRGFVRRHSEPEIHVRVQVVVGLARRARVGEEPDPSRHHADNRQRGWHTAHADGASDDVRIAIELALPEVIAEDDGRWRCLGAAELRVDELPAQDRPQPEHAEVVRRDNHPAHRLAAVGQHEKVERPAVDRRRLDRSRLPPCHPLADGRTACVRATVGPYWGYQQDPAGICVWRRREKRALNQTEHRGSGADAETERHDRDGGKARVLA